METEHSPRPAHQLCARKDRRPSLGAHEALLDHPSDLETRPGANGPQLLDGGRRQRLAMTQEVLKTRTTAAWLERLEGEGVPCAPVLTRDQVISHPQIAASGILLESEHPVAGRLRQTRTAARFEAPTVVRYGAPLLGEHTAEVLGELGLSKADIARLCEQGVCGNRAA